MAQRRSILNLTGKGFLNLPVWFWLVIDVAVSIWFWRKLRKGPTKALATPTPSVSPATATPAPKSKKREEKGFFEKVNPVIGKIF